MKALFTHTALNNAVEVNNIDLMDDNACRELGQLIASECVVVIKDSVSESRLFDIQNLWGQPSRAILDHYVSDGRLSGRHWRRILLNAGYTSRSSVKDQEKRKFMARVSFEKDEKGRAKGIFANGELGWHCDQHAHHDTQRIVGLMSLWGSKNSQTAFLCTARSYAALNHDDKSMVNELMSVYVWDGGSMCEDLMASQIPMVRYHMVPYDGMECPLKAVTASGVEGIKFPSQCFSHFRGMSRAESFKFKDHLWDKLNRPENIYLHDWEDEQIVFMDQNITLHARPTNIKAGNERTLCRMACYMDKLFPNAAPAKQVLVNGAYIAHNEFSKMVDVQKRREFYAS